MKIKDCIKAFFCYLMACLVILVILLPVLLVWFLFKILATPFEYIKFKRSRYQRDFPQKYKWLSEPHIDNKFYTAVKENDLPIEYIKWEEEYSSSGYFLYKDTLLEFHEPLFFDKKRGLWLFWPHENAVEDMREDGEQNEDIDYDNTDDCLTVEEAKEYFLEQFRNNVAGRACNRVVFFYARENVKKQYGNAALDAMRELEDFVIYEKNAPGKVLRQYVTK